MSKFNVGDRVRYIGKDHRKMPEFYPEIGTIGTVAKDGGDTDWCIQWPKGSTSREDCWYCDENDIELVENVDMTNEEIWKMLKPKMERHNILEEPGVLYQGEDKLSQLLNPNIIEGKYVTDVYDATTARYAIALVYRVGYLRAMKGRPFKIGEKKKKGGHWEPVDPENLPKEGTRVRYSRPICFEDEFYLIGWNVGDEGIVNYHGNYFGVKRDGKNWDGVGMFGYYFDMWEEDDE